MIIGLTGPTGAGKSSVTALAEQYGYTVINCDAVAHVVTESGEPLAAIVEEFGSKVLHEDGSLNRKALAELAFADRSHTERLNRTVLPFVVAELKNRLATLKGKKVLLDAPTLYESGADALCDKVIAVLAEEKLRMERIIRRDKLSVFMALMRMSAGQPDAFYRQKADIILENNTTEAAFAEAVTKVFKEEL
ncbi:MAG: dephospho-CoA kinase [Clostridia bacterium]|nr:dephospho-CoA kinase [Clostridia bacterium]